jgi:hypothetical protein
MSWLFSQVLVEEYLGANSLDGKQFAPSSGSHTQQAFLSSDRMKAFSRLSQFGMMFKPLTDDLGEDLLTWFLVGFLVKTSAQPGKEQESKERDHPCGNTWQESSVKFDLNTLSWKTHQCLWEEDLQPSSLTLPKWGMMQSGALWERTTSLLPISETESGFLLPTPTCADTTMGAILNDNTKLITLKSGRMRKISNQGVSGSIGLARTVAMWPTPRVKGQECYETNGKMQKMLGNSPLIRGTTPEEWNGGTLNPTFAEWLMGWPLEWTGLNPLETDKFLLWLNSHGKY